MYNEHAAIESTLTALLRIFDKEEIVVVDDGSTDEGGAIARRLGVTVITHNRNRGYGAAIKTGMKNSAAEYVCWYDADGQHAPQDAHAMFRAAEGLDAVIGVRTNGSGRPWTRKPGMMLLHGIANILSTQKIPDVNCGLRVFRRSTILKYIHLLPDGFSASTTSTLLAVNRGFDFTFWPVAAAPRTGTSTVRQIPAGFGALYLMLRMIILFNPFRFFFPISALLFTAATAYGTAVALINRQGLPVASMLLFMMAFFTFFLGIISDQISEIQKGKFED